MTIGSFGGYSNYQAYSNLSGGTSRIGTGGLNTVASSASGLANATSGRVGTGANNAATGGDGSRIGAMSADLSTGKTAGGRTVGGMNTDGLTEAQIKALKKAGVVECSTCASRKYKDGSDEADVSYKAATHIDPSTSGSKVMAHEQEHVANAYEKAGSKNGEVVSASVTTTQAVCPECGRSYTSGGVTHSVIKYPADNAYGANQKSNDYAAMVGRNFDIGV